MIENKGEVQIEEADDANIPVNITFGPEKDEETEELTGKWELTADNYMPRRSRVEQSQYHIVGTHEEVVAEINKYILPLYGIALSTVTKMSQGEEAMLYYWRE